MTQGKDNQTTASNSKTAIYKKWWFWAVIVIVIVGIAGVGNSQDGSSGQTNEVVSTEATVNEEGTSTSSEDAAPDSFKGVKFSRSDVRNDVTGTWKISSVAETALDPEEYALDYYTLYMNGEKTGVEGIVNFSNKTTTAISDLGGLVDVTVYEYVDGEEHDAKKLFSGAVIKEFQVDPQTGEIEVIR